MISIKIRHFNKFNVFSGMLYSNAYMLKCNIEGFLKIQIKKQECHVFKILIYVIQFIERIIYVCFKYYFKEEYDM